MGMNEPLYLLHAATHDRLVVQRYTQRNYPHMYFSDGRVGGITVHQERIVTTHSGCGDAACVNQPLQAHRWLMS
jgi:hypothetical protein